MLATRPEPEVVALVGDELEVLTPNTITDPDVLLGELSAVRRTGIAVDREEHHVGISAVGTVIANPRGLVMALSIPVPTSRFVEREQHLVERLLAARHRVEGELARGDSAVASPVGLSGDRPPIVLVEQHGDAGRT